MSGTFGYELDLTKLTDEEKETVKAQCDEYRKYYDLINKGELYRLISPWKDRTRCAWSFVSEDKSEALVLVATKTKPHNPKFLLRLKGLLPDANYRIEELCRVSSGRRLMEVGANLTGVMPWKQSHESLLLHLKRVD